jgi:hypothetical protein
LKNDDIRWLKLGWSDFARRRHVPGGKHTWFEGSPEELLTRVLDSWHHRKPGAGRLDREKVVVVPVDPAGFVSSTVLVAEDTPLFAGFERRQEHEEGFIRVTAEGPREDAQYASVVLYSAETLEENDGSRSGDYDWEVVCLIAGPEPDEPMDPLTMARNMLEKPGGTYCHYSAEQFAEAVWYWSCRASAHVPES